LYLCGLHSQKGRGWTSNGLHELFFGLTQAIPTVTASTKRKIEGVRRVRATYASFIMHVYEEKIFANIVFAFSRKLLAKI
jgi:hypothetical protein